MRKWVDVMFLDNGIKRTLKVGINGFKVIKNQIKSFSVSDILVRVRLDSDSGLEKIMVSVSLSYCKAH